MSSFIGDYLCKLDANSRLILPSAFKKQMDSTADGRFVLKKDIYEDCLVLYPMDEWNRLIDEFRQKLNSNNRKHKQFLRGFYKDTAEVTLDSNNRLTIPKNILATVDVKKQVQLVAQDDKIEIWNPETYQNQFDEDAFRKLAEELFGEGGADE